MGASRNYVIFGGSGFIGTHLARLISEREPQARVWNLDTVSPDAIPEAVASSQGSWASVRDYHPALAPGERHPAVWVECDVRRPVGELPFTPGPDDVIINLAAIHRTPGHADADYWNTNVQGAQNICDFARRHGIRRMVLASSISVYGTSEALKTEDSPLDASTPYGASKIEAERISAEWALTTDGHGEKETTDGHGWTQMEASATDGHGEKETTDGHGLTQMADATDNVTETTDGHGWTQMADATDGVKETTGGHGWTRIADATDNVTETTDGHGWTQMADAGKDIENSRESSKIFENSRSGSEVTSVDGRGEDAPPPSRVAHSLDGEVTSVDGRGGDAPHSQSRSLLIVRPGVVFGRGENGNFSRLYRAIRGWRFAYPGRKDTVKAAIYVKELVEFIWWHIHQERPGVAVYNCTIHPTPTIQQICRSMKRVTGQRTPILDIPNWLIMPVAAVIGALGAPMGICPARVRKLQVSTNISGERLAQSGYQMRYTLDEALADWHHDNDFSSLS